MWKFLKNLVKNIIKRTSAPRNLTFEYKKGVSVNANKDETGLWSVDIEADRDLSREDIMSIIKQIKRRK